MELDNQQVTVEDKYKYWLFGMIDGDGSFYFSNQGNKTKNTPHIAISNTDMNIINGSSSVLKMLKIPHYITTRTDKCKSRKLIYKLIIRGLKRVDTFCKNIESYEGCKKVEFELMKKYILSRLSGLSNHPFRDHELEIIEILKKRELDYNVPIFSSYEQQMAWLAGVWDAEGTIGIYKCSSFSESKENYYPVCQIANTNRTIMKTVKKILEDNNIKFYQRLYERKGKNHSNVIFIRIEAQCNCMPFIECIEPCLVGKVNQASIIREFCNLPNSLEKLQLQRFLAEKCSIFNSIGTSETIR